MRCRNCGEPANNYHIRSGGKEFELELCPACYRRLYAERDEFFVMRVGGEKKAKECPACGTRFEDFKRTGLFGCAGCYGVFRAELMPALGRIQGGTRHKGEPPSKLAEENYDAVSALLSEREELKKQYTRAVRENNPQAEKEIADRLRELNRKLSREEEP